MLGKVGLMCTVGFKKKQTGVVGSLEERGVEDCVEEEDGVEGVD